MDGMLLSMKIKRDGGYSGFRHFIFTAGENCTIEIKPQDVSNTLQFGG